MLENSKIMFEESIKSEKSVQSYTWYVQKFIDYYNLENFDNILEIPKDELQKMVATYVIHTKKRVNPNSVPTFCKPIKLFLEVNDVELNWKKIVRLYPVKVKQSGSTAWQTEDIRKMLDSTTQLKNKAIIHFLASTGCRVGALNELKISNLRDMPNDCKMVLVYEDSIEEYRTFLTPEASKALDNYLNERKQLGETLFNDAILFRSRFTLISQKPKQMTTKAIQSIILRAIKNSAIRGQKKNGRYSTQAVHGFRKRFNTILKLNNTVNDNAIEKMMGHKHGLDGVYFQGTIEQLFEEFLKGVYDLTVSGEERNNMKIQKQEEKIKTLIISENEKIQQEEKMKNMEERLSTLSASQFSMISTIQEMAKTDGKTMKKFISIYEKDIKSITDFENS